MNNVSYFDAWQLWLDGKDVSGYCLGGLEILWWGRVGKLVSFFSALAVIADIIGPQKLRQFGQSLHSTFTFNKFAKSIKRTYRGSVLLWCSAGTSDKRKATRLENLYFKSRISFLAFFLAIGLGVSVFLLYRPNIVFRIIVAVLVFVFAFSFITPIIAAILWSLPMIIMLLVDVVLIEPTAWLLEREAIDKLIKVGSILLLLIGFHFDLLAS